MLGLRRVFSVLLVVMVVSAQLFGAIPELCGCASQAHRKDQASCCTDKSRVAQASTGSSCCVAVKDDHLAGCSCDRHGSREAISTSCVCGCDTNPVGEEAPKQTTSRGPHQIEKTELTPLHLAATLALSTQERHSLMEGTSWLPATGMSARILFCIWRT